MFKENYGEPDFLPNGEQLENVTEQVLDALGGQADKMAGEQFFANSEQEHKAAYINSGASLEDCLKHFCSTEPLQDADNLYYCEKCEALVRATGEKYTGSPALRRILLFKPNDTLVINLKRFTQGSYSIHKNSERVPFPSTLDLSPYVLHSIPYEGGDSKQWVY